MRRSILLILFAVVLGLPFVLRAVMMRAGVGRAEVRSGGRRLVVITPHNQDIRREYEKAFDAWHYQRFGQHVVIDYRIPGGTNDIKRQLENTYAKYKNNEGKLVGDILADIDVVWGGGDFFFNNELKRANVLQAIHIDPNLFTKAFPQDRLAGVRLYDSTTDAEGRPMPTWVGVCLSSFGIVYNPDLYATLQLPEPKTWHDLTHEKLFGLVALADPAHSGSASVAYMVVIQRAMADAEETFLAGHPQVKAADKALWPKNAEYRDAIAAGWKKGMGELLLIAANARYFTDSAPMVPNDVGNGEAAAGVAIDFYGRVYEEMVGSKRCRFISPVGATAITPDPVAVLAGVKGEQLELSLRFVAYLLSEEGQRLWILKVGEKGGPVERALRRPPIRKDLYADRHGWADDINPFEESQGFNQRGEWMGTFTDTRMIWAAAWIDSWDGLKESYERILRVKDVLRRSALIAELADLPIELKDVEALPNRMKAEAEGNVEEWKAKERIAWAKRFREHFREVAQRAG